MDVVATAAPEATSPDLVAETFADLCGDFDELLSLVHGARGQLDETAAELERVRAQLQPLSLETVQGGVRRSLSRYGVIGQRLLALRALAEPDGGPPVELIAHLGQQKREVADLLRVEQAITGARVGAIDWQSPSFLHSLAPAVGRHCGQITPHWNDYKRDRHLDGERYERAYLAEMVDGPPRLRALLTSCGMSAFTTVLAFLLLEGKLERPVLIGSGLYHETRLLVERALRGRVHVVDETDTRAVAAALDELRPSAVFLDSLANTKWMPVPDLGAIVERLRGRPTYLVVDNTGLSVACQPFACADESVRLIVFESLLKYAQLGLDRANAGVLVAHERDADALAAYREHLGTNAPDVAVNTLPRPRRWVLARRLERLQRNATLLGERLEREVGPLVRVVYPGLPTHPSFPVARELTFRGGCLSLVLRSGRATLQRERRLLEEAVAEAARRGVALIAGSSFGFDTTRIYLTAARADTGEPFVRIAAGTEHRLELEQLADVLVAAVRTVAA
jgi:cystathionine beta-lyase/cystathionine gamma-synthase